MSIYKNYLKEIRKIAYVGPKAPKNYNMHLLSTPMQAAQETPFNALIKNKSLAFEMNGLPVPNTLKRHLLQPVMSMENETSVGRVTGFRIEVKGRSGSRSLRRVLSYGSLDSGRVGPFGSMVDFAKSSYVTKRGVTGVKVWIAYGSK